MSDEWIWIPNWDEFQHYRDRDPRWIKCYTRLLSHDDYLSLTMPQRGLLHSLWLEYARSTRNTRETPPRVPANTLKLSRRISGKVLQKSLDALVHAGWIRIVDSETLAECYGSASPEKRREEEIEQTDPNRGLDNGPLHNPELSAYDWDHILKPIPD